MRAWLRQPENEDEFMAVGKAGGRCGGFALSPRAVLCVWLARVCVGVGGGGHGVVVGVSWLMCVRFQAAFAVNKSSLCVVIF